MKVVINTAKYFEDLPSSLGEELVETRRSPREIRTFVESQLNSGTTTVPFNTLHGTVANIIGVKIEKKEIHRADCVLNIYKKGKIVQICAYSEEGYIAGFPLDFYSSEDWQD